MTKVRKFHKGDIVTYHSYEWIVKRKRNDMVNLVRRQVQTGQPIWVPSKRLKHADLTWRTNLRAGDPVQLFLGGHWIQASVLRREGNVVCVQPSFTNLTVRHRDSSGHIAKASHDYPLWEEDVNRLVMFQGEIHVERGEGLLFPWTYAEGVPVKPRAHQLITTIQVPVTHTKGFPMKMYNSLSTEEIMYDIFHNFSDSMPTILHKLAVQFVSHRVARYSIRRHDAIDHFAATSLDQNDTRRVNELMSIGEHVDIWSLNEFAVYRHFSRPYFEPKIHYNEDLQLLDIEIYWTGIRAQIAPSLRKIFEMISTPLEYSPPIVEVDNSPEIAYALSRMLGQESEPLEKLYLRKVKNHWLTLANGFCKGSFNTFGGVVDIPGIDYPMLVHELVIRSPLKTLVVVETDTLPMWKKFAMWHGTRREDDLVVVTTRSTLLRSWTTLNGFKRLICVAMPSPGTVYADVVSSMSCKVRWAFSQMGTLSSYIYSRNLPPSHSTDARAFHVLGLPFNSKAVVHMNKTQMEQMGVLFPIQTVQKVICRSKQNIRNILRNISTMPYNKRKEMLSKYLLKPSLVPAYIRGEKLDSYNGTITSIAENFKVDAGLLEQRTKETCAVCLEQIKNPAVTPCGHVFCASCASELDKRNISCALCRSKINGFMRVSDVNTPGKIVMHGGSCYRVQGDDTWGSKYSLLKEHADATFITQYGSVKRVLKKAFPKTTVVTRKAIDNGLRVNTSKIVMVEPEDCPYLDYAWGKDLEIIKLCYTVNV